MFIIIFRLIKLNVTYVLRIVQLHLQFYLNIDFAQLFMALELGLYHATTLAMHHNRLPRTKYKYNKLLTLSPTNSSSSSYSKSTQSC